MSYSLVMVEPIVTNKYAVTAFLTLLAGAVAFGVPARAETAGLEQYFTELADPANPAWARAESDIRRAWSRSGSPAMDLLLKRGQAAIDEGDYEAAIAHLTALTDHAPDFAEGWNARATAYFMAGQFGPSIEDVAKTLSLEPRHWGALAGLGAMFEDMGQRTRALAAFKASFALNPHQQDVKDAIDRLQQEMAGVAL